METLRYIFMSGDVTLHNGLAMVQKSFSALAPYMHVSHITRAIVKLFKNKNVQTFCSIQFKTSTSPFWDRLTIQCIPGTGLVLACKIMEAQATIGLLH